MPALDDDYANAAYIPDGATYPPLWAEKAKHFRETWPHSDLGARYGPSERQCYDLFFPEGPMQGTVVFVHGGYWRAFDRSSWSHLAAGPLARGWAVAMPSYDLCPSVRIATITQQIAQAVMTIADRQDGLLALAGHSAGGHLVARMLAPGMLRTSDLGRIMHVMPISPLSDLEPLLHTAMNDDFRMDGALARAESPLCQPVPDRPVTVWVGADERPAFLDQAIWLVEHWDAVHIVADGKHHFNVIDDLAYPDSDMTNRLCRL